MTQAISPPLSFLEFLETTPEDGKRYELVNGERVQLMATRAHDDVADFIYDAFRDEVRRDRLNYKISRFASVKTRRDDGLVQGRTPDVSVIDRTVWAADPKADAALYWRSQNAPPFNLHIGTWRISASAVSRQRSRRLHDLSCTHPLR